MNQDFDAYLHNHRAEHLDELTTLLRFPSISTLSEHAVDVVRCAEHLAELARTIGFENIQLLQTARHPVLYADWLHAEGKPTVLVYGHYDVQPVDPLHLWETPPFEPTIRDGKIYARGASDDKGQVFMHLKSFEALMKTTGSLPVNVKLCIEGEEEIGSPNLPSVLNDHKDLFAADVLVISDTTILGPNRPSVCYGLRGLAALQVDLYGAKGDLHSGLYGGSIQNPLHAMVELLASLHDKSGVIQVKGFYDDVEAISQEEQDAFAKLAPDDAKLADSLGLPELFGEAGYTTLERQWVRPTLELNGVYGGFQGEGTKTVIPNSAHAKITCRLVPNQDPVDIQRKIQQHLKDNAPLGIRVEVTLQDTGKPYVTPFDHPTIQLASKAYAKAYGTAAAFTRMGGSIPIVEAFAGVLDIPVVLMGFGLDTENFHAPNEHFTLDNFDKGLRALCYYWLGLEEALQSGQAAKSE
ncbi:dipeptidase [Alicyclobacillus ferrooxydans]|uniref:Peptidase M20 n=1 Tax=Alicyclobacillus ferrooxydans TaxID=471514 RepID=A0A0P9CYX1_9BACL|nr:dipeptidase [Alicyclobacillus ferrooxydans]KPV42169.1 peptidase M20 [Alicyclobacillus ferrooxydans]